MKNFNSLGRVKRDRIIAKIILVLLDAGIKVDSPYVVENFASDVLSSHADTIKFFYNEDGDEIDVKKFCEQLLGDLTK